MKLKAISILMAFTFLIACNENVDQSTTVEDSTTIQKTDNTAVSPGTPDPVKNGAGDSTINKTDSLARDKR